MKSVAGIFTARADAEQAVARLVSLGVLRERINLLIPGISAEELHTVTPTTETEGSGMGKAVGAVVGGASGAMLGGLGAAAASLLIPGIGPVAAIGFAAMALFGAGGAVAGAAAGASLENQIDGLPTDELYVYEDALRDGRCVVLVLADGGEAASDVERSLEESGAESVDAARDRWWLAIRDSESEQYRADGGDFDVDELAYRRGFERAHHGDVGDHSFDEVRERLGVVDPDLVDTAAYRLGFERGRLGRAAWHEAEATPR